jgi:hypothetical protein
MNAQQKHTLDAALGAAVSFGAARSRARSALYKAKAGGPLARHHIETARVWGSSARASWQDLTKLKAELTA